MMDLKGTTIWDIFMDSFQLMKEALPVVTGDRAEEDRYWEKLLDQASMIANKYGDHPEKDFAMQQVLSVTNEIERIYKEKKGVQ